MKRHGSPSHRSRRGFVHCVPARRSASESDESSFGRRGSERRRNVADGVSQSLLSSAKRCDGKRCEMRQAVFFSVRSNPYLKPVFARGRAENHAVHRTLVRHRLPLELDQGLIERSGQRLQPTLQGVVPRVRIPATAVIVHLARRIQILQVVGNKMIGLN